MIAVIVVNYRRAADTVECLDSLLRVAAPAFDIFLVDNGSSAADVAQLRDYVARHPERIHFTAFPQNLGFTGAHNRLFEQWVPSHRYEFFLLVNNDAVVESDFLEHMLARLDPSQQVAMVAARVMKYADRSQIDNLGITFYKCGLASNRKSPDDPLLGPSGNCALYTAELLRAIHQATGEYFDEHFFCYAEDTDLAWRAVLLGYRAAYAEDALVYHKGSISSGGPNSDFVLYHGIRNSLFVLVKDIPARFLLGNLFWMVVLHVAILLRYTVKGKLGVVARLYRDFVRGIPGMRRKRRPIQQQRQIPPREIRQRISRLFYERGYALGALRDLY
ncbi:MAG: glycosyltransferase family 2 protein [Candidatus Competibacteraceae bacterium]|nr:glycosyltransferase family 2 protein [Candidatus Competibacteraceae bacterium]MBK7984863.1 glycosyltransferase family 2 protein [Candidatus Competibacteraceae bacterium]MBK8899373.1 glycosyltransferase family 2 protein [Candidatus Competibacteraceae bacterium]MBK8964377.1 glycosyltransferase family 2 protein [Candidatus Competibacteraceae bacterium]MBK9952365.1 glycosyltransferase family 2 protein [Candidatus Competibacteraceae bacterium]